MNHEQHFQTHRPRAACPHIVDPAQPPLRPDHAPAPSAFPLPVDDPQLSETATGSPWTSSRANPRTTARSPISSCARSTRPGARSPATRKACSAPADGRLSELELVSEDRATQVKGWTYPLSLMLGEAIDFSQGWHVATIYLSPSDYHRFHYPLSGRISGSFHGGTRLFPVNDFSVSPGEAPLRPQREGGDAHRICREPRCTWWPSAPPSWATSP